VPRPAPRPQQAALDEPAPRQFGDKLLGGAEIGPLAVEQYRRVAAVLHQAQRDRAIRTVMVGSAVAGEGKTLTAANLALTLSESYRRRVLLVDADLRRPMLHEVLGVGTTAGLSGVLNAQLDGSRAIVHVTPMLSLIPGGQPNPDPMSGLSSERMGALVREAGERFDWVILDTPPLALVPDANLLSALVDAAVLVVSAARTPFDAVQKAVDAIGRQRVLGVVLNNVDERSLSAQYGADGHYRYAAAERAPA
jgi:capsular exopolysaccharide synthesis family protein